MWGEISNFQKHFNFILLLRGKINIQFDLDFAKLNGCKVTKDSPKSGTSKKLPN